MLNWENDHVHKFYSKYASDFNITRVKTWPKIACFLSENDRPGFTNLDAGCGNGRNLRKEEESIWIGLDYSRELLECILKKEKQEILKNDKKECVFQRLSSNEFNEYNDNNNILYKENIHSTHNLIRGDCLSFPFKDFSFNLILSIAVIHHFSTPERRSKALKEMYRILKSRGKILLYVWNEEIKKKKKFKQIRDKDYLVKFNGIFDRYYYLYNLEEIVGVCKENGFLVEENGIEQESLYLILRKS